MAETIRVAAAGDIHCAEPLRERITRAFAELHGQADVVLLAGDLTTHGNPDEAAGLADACRPLDVPVYAVLGNHDYHANRCDELIAVLEDGGIVVLQRGFAVHELGGVELGIVGGKGFVGGFPGAELPDFGEPLLREVYAETTREVDALEAGLEEISGCHRRIVLLHYAPIPETLVGEPAPISASVRRSPRTSASVAPATIWRAASMPCVNGTERPIASIQPGSESMSMLTQQKSSIRK